MMIIIAMSCQSFMGKFVLYEIYIRYFFLIILIDCKFVIIHVHVFGIVSEILKTYQGDSWTDNLCLGLAIFLLQKSNK